MLVLFVLMTRRVATDPVCSMLNNAFYYLFIYLLGGSGTESTITEATQQIFRGTCRFFRIKNKPIKNPA
jgi:hypothetical protein